MKKKKLYKRPAEDGRQSTFCGSELTAAAALHFVEKLPPSVYTHTCVSPAVVAPFSHMQTPLLRIRGIRTCFHAFQKAAERGGGLRLTPPPPPNLD